MVSRYRYEAGIQALKDGGRVGCRSLCIDQFPSLIHDRAVYDYILLRVRSTVIPGRYCVSYIGE